MKTDENGGKTKMDAVLKKARGSKGNLRERSATLFNGQTVISIRDAPHSTLTV